MEKSKRVLLALLNAHVRIELFCYYSILQKKTIHIKYPYMGLSIVIHITQFDRNILQKNKGKYNKTKYMYHQTTMSSQKCVQKNRFCAEKLEKSLKDIQKNNNN